MESKQIQFADNRNRNRCSGNGFSRSETVSVRRVQEMLPEYSRTPLVSLQTLAKELGVRGVLVKDESCRFGLKAFKGLGGIYAVFMTICRELGLDPDETSIQMLQNPPLIGRVRQMVFATTTDGNHGKGISWASGIFGCKSFVFMPTGSAEVRAQAIRDAGNAEVLITDMHYDDCVAWTAKQAREKGWHLIQDTSWDGYEEVPLWVMQGYTTLYYEALDQMRTMGFEAPTHLFLQAGVGSMAGAVAAAACSNRMENPPVIATVESAEAACFYESFRKGTGQPQAAHGSEVTIMAGLNCSVPCPIAWEILGNCAVGGFACIDNVTCRGMRLLAGTAGKDPSVISGESGAVTAGLLDMLLREPEYQDLCRKLKLNSDSVILLVSTEGDTDPENYARIVYDGVHSGTEQDIPGKNGSGCCSAG